MTEPDRLYHLEAARSDAQRERMEALERDRICVFCVEHQEQEIVHRGSHWYVTLNRYPYEGTTAHWLIVPFAHVRAFDELPDEAGAELWAIKRRLKDQSGAIATATVERSGDMRFNGGSVAHLHVHFVAPDPEPSKTVRFRVSAFAE
jgi:diadenosine tetraphosphate (Ap4A) HIT family hydrolase